MFFLIPCDHLLHLTSFTFYLTVISNWLSPTAISNISASALHFTWFSRTVRSSARSARGWANHLGHQTDQARCRFFHDHQTVRWVCFETSTRWPRSAGWSISRVGRPGGGLPITHSRHGFDHPPRLKKFLASLWESLEIGSFLGVRAVKKLAAKQVARDKYGQILCWKRWICSMDRTWSAVAFLRGRYSAGNVLKSRQANPGLRD